MNIKQFIQNLDVETFVEIGAHFCTDTIDFRRMHPNARIVCFEPDPRNIKVIKELGNDKICELYEFALSNINQPMDFHLSSGNPSGKTSDPLTLAHDWSYSSSLKEPTGHLNIHKWITFPSSVKVNCMRLDDFEPLKNTKIDFMWVDVQGAEDLVFGSAEKTLKNTHYVYTEYSNDGELYKGQLSKEDICKLLGANFKLIKDFSGDMLLENVNFSK